MAIDPQTLPDARPQAVSAQPHAGDQILALGDKLLSLARGVTSALHGGGGAASPLQSVLHLAHSGVLKGVKDALDVRAHVRRHPWLAVGCAAALGLFCSGLLRRR